jgi:hypothetical protein
MNDEPKVELQDAFKYKNFYVGRPFALPFVVEKTCPMLVAVLWRLYLLAAE